MCQDLREQTLDKGFDKLKQVEEFETTLHSQEAADGFFHYIITLCPRLLHLKNWSILFCSFSEKPVQIFTTFPQLLQHCSLDFLQTPLSQFKMQAFFLSFLSFCAFIDTTSKGLDSRRSRDDMQQRATKVPQIQTFC